MYITKRQTSRYQIDQSIVPELVEKGILQEYRDQSFFGKMIKKTYFDKNQLESYLMQQVTKDEIKENYPRLADCGVSPSKIENDVAYFKIHDLEKEYKRKTRNQSGENFFLIGLACTVIAGLGIFVYYEAKKEKEIEKMQIEVREEHYKEMQELGRK